MKYPRVCIVSSAHSLLLYLLMSEESVIENTFFFVERINVNLKNSVRLCPPNNNMLSFFLWMTKLRLLAITKYRFVKDAEIFCQDSISISSPLVDDRSYILLEDGLSSYVYKKRRIRWKLIKKIFCGSLFTKEFFGYSEQAKKIVYTGILPTPPALEKKAIVVDMKELWEKSSEKKKNFIKSVFGANGLTVNHIKRILITQPFSEDCTISEIEKVELYKGIIEGKDITIKPHPRETTDYSTYFPELTIIKPTVPLELLLLMGMSAEEAYTVFSTSIFDFPENVEKHFVGTVIHPKLVTRYGSIEFKNGKVVGELYKS